MVSEFKPWITYQGVSIKRHAPSGAYYYKTSHIRLDADGSPRAYHPNDTGLDYLANAGYPNKNWWKSVLVVDPVNGAKAYVQSSGPTAGYFLSKTALADLSKPDTDAAKWVNSEVVPYIVFPGNFHTLEGTGSLGDHALVRCLSTGKESPAIVADVGPADAELGEISLALATALGGQNPNPRNGSGSPPGPLEYLIFPKSAPVPKWPQDFLKVQNDTAARLMQLGGWIAAAN